MAYNFVEFEEKKIQQHLRRAPSVSVELPDHSPKEPSSKPPERPIYNVRSDARFRPVITSRSLFAFRADGAFFDFSKSQAMTTLAYQRLKELVRKTAIEVRLDEKSFIGMKILVNFYSIRTGKDTFELIQ